MEASSSGEKTNWISVIDRGIIKILVFHSNKKKTVGVEGGEKVTD